MLNEAEEKKVKEYVNEHLDGQRLDVIILEKNRVILEQSDSKVIVIDKDFLIDASREYEVLVRNPVEKYFFIPTEIDYYETKMILEFDRKECFQIINLIDTSAISSESVPLVDQRLTDNCLRNLVRHMCFDRRHQELYPEVKTVIDDFFSNPVNKDSLLLKQRMRQFFGL